MVKYDPARHAEYIHSMTSYLRVKNPFSYQIIMGVHKRPVDDMNAIQESGAAGPLIFAGSGATFTAAVGSGAGFGETSSGEESSDDQEDIRELIRSLNLSKRANVDQAPMPGSPDSSTASSPAAAHAAGADRTTTEDGTSIPKSEQPRDDRGRFASAGDGTSPPASRETSPEPGREQEGKAYPTAGGDGGDGRRPHRTEPARQMSPEADPANVMGLLYASMTAMLLKSQQKKKRRRSKAERICDRAKLVQTLLGQQMSKQAFQSLKPIVRVCLWYTGNTELYSILQMSLTLKHKAIIACVQVNDGYKAWVTIRCRYLERSAGAKSAWMSKFLALKMRHTGTADQPPSIRTYVDALNSIASNYSLCNDGVPIESSVVRCKLLELDGQRYEIPLSHLESDEANRVLEGREVKSNQEITAPARRNGYPRTAYVFLIFFRVCKSVDPQWVIYFQYPSRRASGCFFLQGGKSDSLLLMAICS